MVALGSCRELRPQICTHAPGSCTENLQTLLESPMLFGRGTLLLYGHSFHNWVIFCPQGAPEFREGAGHFVWQLPAFSGRDAVPPALPYPSNRDLLPAGVLQGQLRTLSPHFSVGGSRAYRQGGSQARKQAQLEAMQPNMPGSAAGRATITLNLLCEGMRQEVDQ